MPEGGTRLQVAEEACTGNSAATATTAAAAIVVAAATIQHVCRVLAASSTARHPGC